MRVSVLALAAAVALLWGTVAAVAAADQNANTAGETAATASAQHPTAVLPELSYEFEAVVDGTEISHDFSVKNTGEGVLAILQVKTG